MEGCSAPLVVKFADTQKEKDQKKMQQLQASICGITALTTPAIVSASSAIAAITASPTNCLSSSTALVPQPVAARTTPSMAAALAAAAAPSAAQLSGNTSLMPTSVQQQLASMSPSLLATPAQQQTAAFFTSDPMQTPAGQLHLFQQLQAFGLHPTQYLQGEFYQLQNRKISIYNKIEDVF